MMRMNAPSRRKDSGGEVGVTASKQDAKPVYQLSSAPDGMERRTGWEWVKMESQTASSQSRGMSSSDGGEGAIEDGAGA